MALLPLAMGGSRGNSFGGPSLMGTLKNLEVDNESHVSKDTEMLVEETPEADHPGAVGSLSQLVGIRQGGRNLSKGGSLDDTMVPARQTLTRGMAGPTLSAMPGDSNTRRGQRSRSFLPPGKSNGSVSPCQGSLTRSRYCVPVCASIMKCRSFILSC